MFVRIQEPKLVKELQRLEMQGSVTVGAFATKTQGSGGDEVPPLCDTSVAVDQLEEVGTLAQMKGLNWSTTDGVETVRDPAAHASLPSSLVAFQPRCLPASWFSAVKSGALRGRP